MSVEIWTAISGVAGLVFGVAGLIVAVRANGRADAANRLSKEANEISERALKSSERLGREQIDLLQREVEMAHGAERRKRSADILVSPARRTSGGEFRLRVENRGPHHADRIALSLHADGNILNVVPPTSLPPGKVTELTGKRGSFFAGAVTNEDDDLSRDGEQTVDLRVTFTDGNGPRLVRKRLTIGPGSRFVNRRWEIEDWPAEA